MVDYDMHIHTSASDGLWEPERIFKYAKRIGLKGIAITDHDTIEVLEACGILSHEYDVDFVPGIEVSTDNNGFEVHILGYFIDYANIKLREFLMEQQYQRENRAVSIVSKLNKLGIKIDFEEVKNEAGLEVKSIGRPHVARVLVKKGYFKDTGEVFKYLLNKGKPAYIEKNKVSIEKAADIINLSGGIPVLAHPFIDTGLIRGQEFLKFLERIAGYGIKGIEAYHTMHSREDEKYLVKTAKDLNLAITGGSDFHGTFDDSVPVLGIKGINKDEFLKFKYI